MYPIPTSDHNEELSGDTLTSVLLNYEWRKIIADAIDIHFQKIAATIDDESDRQQFEGRYGALMEDFYNEDVVDNTPVGMVAWFPVDAADIPAKWLICNGAAVSQTTYPALYNMLRHNFGSGGGTFNLPDLTSRFLYGAGIDANIGATGGSNTHTLTTDEMPAHGHTQRTRGGTAGAIATTAGYLANASSPLTTSTSTTADAGGGQAHNNMPAYMRGYWCIKALP